MQNLYGQARAILSIVLLGVTPASAITPALPDPPLWESGAWLIQQNTQSKDSLQLVGRDADGRPGIGIECHRRSSVVGIFVGTDVSFDAVSTAPLTVMAWNEQNRKLSMKFSRITAARGFLLFDPNVVGDGPPGARSFLSMLRHAKTSITLHAGNTIRRFDAKDLGAGFEKFDARCHELR